MLSMSREIMVDERTFASVVVIPRWYGGDKWKDKITERQAIIITPK